MGNNSQKSSDIKITILESDSQSNELYDYYSKQNKQTSYQLQLPSYLHHDQSNHLILSTQYKPNSLFQLSQPIFGSYQLSINCIQAKDLWRTIKTKQPIHKGYFIKIGKVKLEVKQINITTLNSLNSSLISNQSQTFIDQESQLKNKAIKEQQCRICFDSQQTIKNPLVSLCKCSGSVKYIHYKCLKDWVATNINKKINPHYLFYSYLFPKCQICKSYLQLQFSFKDKNYNIFQIEKLQPPYVILESVEEIDDDRRKDIYIIKLQQNKHITIGRNNSCQVMIKDISISRTHCAIIYQNKNIFIEDRNSKFGTLVMLQKNDSYQLGKDVSLPLQYQNKIIKIQQNSQSGGCCIGPEVYYTVNYKSQPYKMHANHQCLDKIY